jgi:hypothetical protein
MAILYAARSWLPTLMVGPASSIRGDCSGLWRTAETTESARESITIATKDERHHQLANAACEGSIPGASTLFRMPFGHPSRGLVIAPPVLRKAFVQAGSIPGASTLFPGVFRVFYRTVSKNRPAATVQQSDRGLPDRWGQVYVTACCRQVRTACQLLDGLARRTTHNPSR